MIKVLHYGLSPNKGGIETYLHKIYTNIDKNKFQFDFINLHGNEVCYYEDFKSMGSQFYSITSRRKTPMNYRKSLNNLFTTNNFDILHCHLNTLSDIDPILIALRHKSKVIVHSTSAGISNSLITNLLHKLNFLRLPKNKIKMLAVSDKAGEWLFGKNSNYTVLNLGIDADRFKFNKMKRKQLRDKLELQDELIIGHVGTFIKVKNHDFLVDIFYELKKVNKNAKLILIGEGPLKESIEIKVRKLNINDSVLFLGRRDDVQDLLNVMDIFLMPSFYEGFPTAVLEAQASGLPCLISDNITKEVALADDCLMLSLDCSAEQWATTLLSIEAQKDRSAGRCTISDNGLLVEDEIKRIEEIYDSLIN